MIERADFVRQVQGYDLVMLKVAWDDIVGQIAAIPEMSRRQEAQIRLDELREEIRAMDLSAFGWPPQSGENRKHDLLLADTQRLVSAVILFDHEKQKSKVLKFVLKERP
jgi:hypothetical protein